MVETITPVVHGNDRLRYRLSVLVHIAGGVLSSVLMGAALGALGAGLGMTWSPGTLIAVAAVSALYLIREVAAVPVPLPEVRRQVPEWWRTFFSPPTAAFLYGMGLGVGFFTYLRHGTLVGVAVAAFTSGDPLVGILVCSPFGLARGISVLLGREAKDETEAAALADQIASMGETLVPRVANSVALAGIGAAALLA
jgi:hypothetical protein